MKPIVQSPLWEDFYKFSMQLFTFRNYPDVWVKFGLKNRSNAKYPLVNLVDEQRLRWELDAAREAVRFSAADREHIASFANIHHGFAEPDYQSFLRNCQLPPYGLSREGTTYRVESRGWWPEAMMWETKVMRICACLAGETLARHTYGANWLDAVRRENDLRLSGKIARMKRYPDLHVVEFATRRSFAPEIQDYNVGRLSTELLPGQLLGTSNVFLAWKHNLPALGTMAHELWMVLAALTDACGANDEQLRATQMRVCDEWYKFFAPNLLTVLNETFGSEAFYEDFGAERARSWDGHRPDSGDPISEGDKVIAFLERCGVDPKTKKLTSADGQTVAHEDGMEDDSMIRCHEHFRGRINDVYGWGTNCGNDVGVPTLSIVMKAGEANSCPTVKLSNNRAKAQGPRDKIARYERAFGYTSTFQQECRY